jgi:O-6-methylguanine DNA methyltransferase
LNEIKFGQRISYTELAVKSTGNANASRAVGTAMKRNPFQLIVPCHRVVKKDGTFGHYSGGHDLKDWLLLYEKSFSGKSLH